MSDGPYGAIPPMPPTTHSPPFGPNVSQVDVDAARQLHSFFCNRIFIQPEGGNLRIHLGEMVAGAPVYHFAVTVSKDDALSFGHLITEMAVAALEREKIAHQLKSHADQPGNG